MTIRVGQVLEDLHLKTFKSNLLTYYFRQIHWDMYAAGFNGFGQISTSSNQYLVKIPISLTSSYLECLTNSVHQAKSAVIISWSSIGIINENNDLIISGFMKEQERQSLNLGSLVLCSNVGSIVMTTFGNLYFINKEGKLSYVAVNENIQDTQGKQCLGDYVFTHMAFSEVFNRLYMLSEDGQLWCIEMDENRFIKPTTLLSLPLPSPSHVIHKLSCGISHCLALSMNGLVFSWGTGSRGQLGHGKLKDEENPKLIECLQGVKILTISAGGWHSTALADTGDLYVWGCNKHGQLGFPALQDFHSCSSIFRKKDVQNLDDRTQLAVPMLHMPTLLELEERLNSEEFITITCISCGTRHSAAVTSSGQAVTWGWSKYGQLSHECCAAREFAQESGVSKANDEKENDVCSDKPHLPNIVPYFSDNNLVVTSVACGHWNTVYQTKIKRDE